MALIDTPKLDLVRTFNRGTYVPLDLAHSIFSPVFPNVDDPRTTQIRFTLTSESEYRGSEVLTYRRLDLASLSYLLFQEPCFYPNGNTLYQILDTIANGMGVRLERDDVYDAPVVEQEGGFTVQLTAKPGSYRWVGEHLLRFKNLPPLYNIIDYQHVTW